MGLAYAPISLIMLREAPAGREGWASASLNLTDVLGTAVGIGVGGAAVAATVRGGQSLALGIAVAFAAAGAVGLAGRAVTRRLPGGPLSARRPPSRRLPSAPMPRVGRCRAGGGRARLWSGQPASDPVAAGAAAARPSDRMALR